MRAILCPHCHALQFGFIICTVCGKHAQSLNGGEKSTAQDGAGATNAGHADVDIAESGDGSETKS